MTATSAISHNAERYRAPCNNSCTQKQVWERLKLYEDIGLPPDIIREYKKFEDELVSDGLSYAEFLKMLKERERQQKGRM